MTQTRDLNKAGPVSSLANAFVLKSELWCFFKAQLAKVESMIKISMQFFQNAHQSNISNHFKQPQTTSI
jgi:hypothetical protein